MPCVFKVLWLFQIEAVGWARQMTLTHAEPRLKPLGDTFQASAAETRTHKRSQSYSGYIPYYLQPPQDDLGDGEHGGRFTSPRDAVTASVGGGTGCAPQCWPDTDDSDTERYVWTQSNQGNFTAVGPDVRSLPLPSVLTVNRVHSGLQPLSNTLEAWGENPGTRIRTDSHSGYMPYYLQLPPARADYMRQASVQPDGAVSHASASELTSGSRQLVSAGSTRHHDGWCKPCAFVDKGKCADGISCDFCHLCTPGEKKRRRREKIKKAKEVWRLKKDLLRSPQFCNQ